MGHSSSYQQATAKLSGGPYDDDDDDDDERMYASVFTGEELADDGVERKRRQRAGGAKPSWLRTTPQEHYGNHKPWK